MFRHITAQHIYVFGGLLTAIGVMGASMHSWEEIRSVPFVFGCLGVIGAHIAAAFGPSPKTGQPKDE